MVRAQSIERIADALQDHLDDPRALQMYGTLHLNAALASAVMRRSDDAADHLNEAGAIANRIGADDRGFGDLYFGPDNVGIWRISIAVELGELGRAREIARGVHPEQVPSTTRQAMYWADLGRGMAHDRATRDDAVGALLRAEKLAPQRIRTNPFVRETVGDLTRRAQRKAVGRELRGMAHRMGLGVGLLRYRGARREPGRAGARLLPRLRSVEGVPESVTNVARSASLTETGQARYTALLARYIELPAPEHGSIQTITEAPADRRSSGLSPLLAYIDSRPC